MKKVLFYRILLLILLTGLSVSQKAFAAATMNDYCITPPFVVGGVKPNLLLLIDNSASMFDLQYVDGGKFSGTCSGHTTQTCSDSANCPTNEACINKTFTRNPYYCYDETFNSKNTYVGYFPAKDSSGNPLYYQYDFTNDIFNQVASLPSSCPSGTSKSISGSLFMCPSGSTVSLFAASGSYLNWLVASKFDVEKQILTGGKYVSKVCSVNPDMACTADSDCVAVGGPCIIDPRGIKFLQDESRGCVGRKYIKEPLTADFVNYASACTLNNSTCVDANNDGRDDNDPNTPLGVTFGIRGPVDPRSATSLSPGGQTYIDIFSGVYFQLQCQNAINLLQNPSAHKQDIVNAIDACLNNAATNKKTCQNDQTTTCNSDTDCIISAGTCNIQNNGVCSVSAAGTCAVTTAGVCMANNGTCQGSGNNKTCSGGGKAGASCKKDTDCAFKSCTIGNVGAACSFNSDCNLKSCTAGKVGSSCVVNADCNLMACSAPASKSGKACTVSTDCNDNACSSSAPVNANGFCTSNWDCSDTKGHCMAPATTQTKSTFTQSMNSCYQLLFKGNDVGSNEIQQVTNPAGCNQIYAQYKTCTGGAHDGAVCGSNADCGGGICSNGPDSIKPGSPVLLCSTAYCGYCASNPNNDNWQTTSWVAREYASPDQCILAKYREYCNAADIPPVTDPTDSPSQTDQFGNLPAIIGDMGVESQLNNPIATLKAQYKLDTEPTNLLQLYSDLIRFGVMRFNYFGSPTECSTTVPLPAGAVACPKRCSATPSISCTIDLNCPSGETCIATTKNVDNLDGGLIAAYIGDPGTCSVTTTDTCTKDSNCSSGEKCVMVGNHNYGLINTVDGMRGSTWTPFGEAFYDAVGYLARTNDYTVSPGTSRTALRLNTGDFAEDKNPSQFECQANNVLLITDGMSTTDQRVSATAIAYNGAAPAPAIPPTTATCPSESSCPLYKGSTDIEQMAWIAKNRNIKNFDPASASPAPTSPLKKSQYINTFVTFTGSSNGQAGDCNSDTLMSNTATYGGTTLFRAEHPEDLRNSLNKAFQQVAAGASSGTAASVLASGEGSGANLIQALFYPSRTFSDSVCSSTRSRVCTMDSDCPTGESCLSRTIKWIGALQNFWYFVDPQLGNSSILEDTQSPYTLNLKDDDILTFQFDGTNTIAYLYTDPGGNGVPGALDAKKCLDETLTGTLCCPDCSSEPLKYLWEAGKNLYLRAASDRKIWTTKTGLKDSEIQLSDPVTDDELKSLLNAATLTEATSVVQYIEGIDVKVCDNSTGTGSKTTCLKDGAAAGSCPAGETCSLLYRNRTINFAGQKGKTWKLGDVINSTPKISSSAPLNLYHKVYNDQTYKNFISSADYLKRGTVFVGANDGMLHALNLGTLGLINDNTPNKATLGAPANGGVLGDEAWTYIPRSALPYLKYLADANYGDSNHLYYVDATPFIFDASIGGGADSPKPSDGSTWRTVLIGGMRFGGASGKGVCSNNAAKACLLDTECGAGTCVTGSYGVKPPIDKNGAGYSSYFALDITDPAAPHVMWEFSDANLAAADKGLGFTTTGPAVVRINGKTGSTPDPKTNGNWYVVFASGPTGPIDTTTHQFKGFSNQNLKVYILDLRDGTLLNAGKTDTGITNAFAGSLINAPIDFNQDDPSNLGFYSDDALYFGYTQAEVADLTQAKWTKGGVLRLVTHESPPDVTDWTLSTVVDNSVDSSIGPVTASVGKLRDLDKKIVRLYFGTGRYYYKVADQVDDAGDSAINRRLYGVVEPCYKNDTLTGNFGMDTACTDKAGTGCPPLGNINCGPLGNVTTSSANAGQGGWFIDLDLCTDLTGAGIACSSTTGLKAERMVTDPLATPIGVVFFTTTKPTADACEFGGRTHFWAVQFDTGGAVKKGILKGKALVQTSTGSIEQVDLSTGFTPSGGGNTTERFKVDAGASSTTTVEGRRTDMIPGVPPSGSPPGILIPPRPVNKIIHVKER